MEATNIRLAGTDRNPFDMSRHESTSCRHPIDTPSTVEGELKTKILNGSGLPLSPFELRGGLGPIADRCLNCVGLLVAPNF